VLHCQHNSWCPRSYRKNVSFTFVRSLSVHISICFAKSPKAIHRHAQSAPKLSLSSKTNTISVYSTIHTSTLSTSPTSTFQVNFSALFKASSHMHLKLHTTPSPSSIAASHTTKHPNTQSFHRRRIHTHQLRNFPSACL